jgi:hypothetical protein
VPATLLRAFEQANHISYRYYVDPNWSRLARTPHYLEAEQRELASDVWPTGVARNRMNIERFIGYLHEQGLIRSRMALENLFTESTLETRGIGAGMRGTPAVIDEYRAAIASPAEAQDAVDHRDNGRNYSPRLAETVTKVATHVAISRTG